MRMMSISEGRGGRERARCRAHSQSGGKEKGARRPLPYSDCAQVLLGSSELHRFGLTTTFLEDEVVALGRDELGLGLASTGTGRDQATNDDVFLEAFEQVGLAGNC